MRKATLLLLLLVPLALELEHVGDRRSHPSSRSVPARTAADAQVEHLLTSLDFWNQEIVPYVLLEQGRERALKIGDVASAERIERRLLPGLMRVQRLFSRAALDRALWEDRSVKTRALRAALRAWSEWTSGALLWPPPSAPRLASLEAKAARLNQKAYAAVDASLRAALTNGPLKLPAA